jgi:hypothetical protein
MLCQLSYSGDARNDKGAGLRQLQRPLTSETAVVAVELPLVWFGRLASGVSPGLEAGSPSYSVPNEVNNEARTGTALRLPARSTTASNTS